MNVNRPEHLSANKEETLFHPKSVSAITLPLSPSAGSSCLMSFASLLHAACWKIELYNILKHKSHTKHYLYIRLVEMLNLFLDNERLTVVHIIINKQTLVFNAQVF